jgi:rhodanese-related sulfurtransferase
MPAAPWIALAAVVLIAAAIVLLIPKAPVAEEIDVSRAYEMYQQGAFVVDVRTQAEWDEVHIPGTVLIPLDELPDRLNEVPRDKDIVVVCRSGNRSEEGAAILLKAGYESVVGMEGGIRDWSAAGYPVE